MLSSSRLPRPFHRHRPPEWTASKRSLQHHSWPAARVQRLKGHQRKSSCPGRVCPGSLTALFLGANLVLRSILPGAHMLEGPERHPRRMLRIAGRRREMPSGGTGQGKDRVCSFSSLICNPGHRVFKKHSTTFACYLSVVVRDFAHRCQSWGRIPKFFYRRFPVAQ